MDVTLEMLASSNLENDLKMAAINGRIAVRRLHALDLFLQNLVPEVCDLIDNRPHWSLTWYMI